MDDENPTIEDRLRSALAAGIAQVESEVGPPVADPADLTRRRIRHHRRQGIARAAAVIVIVLGAAVGGWGVGRDRGRSDVEKVASAEHGPDDRQLYEATSTSVAALDSDAGSRVVIGPDDVPIVVPQPPDPGTDSGRAARIASATGSDLALPFEPWYDGMPLPTATATTRELADGAELRVGLNRYDPAIYELPPFWDPPAWCFPSGDVEVEVDDAAGGPSVVRTVRYAATEEGRVEARTTVVGAETGTDRWVTVVQAPPGAATIRAEYPDGQVDEAPPVDGVGVLSTPVGSGVGGLDLESGPLTVVTVAERSDGTELARHEGPWTEDELGDPVVDPPYARPACTVPTELPEPGLQQPEDPAAAEAAVRAVWEEVWAHPGAVTTEQQLAVVQDTRGVGAALDTVKAGVSEEVLDQTTISIDGVVFASPAQAFVAYRVDIASGTYARLFGELVLDGGTWKVTRGTACDLAETGGGICEPLVDG